MAGLGSISKSLTSTQGERRASCSLLELDDTGTQTGNNYVAFQYFPESISDNKSSNYQSKDIPGGSLPLYQWMSGGERNITFTAMFTTDLDLLQDGVSFPKLVQNGQVRRNIDPRSAIVWLRRFMYPRYGSTTQVGVPLTLSPRQLILYIPNSGIGLAGAVSRSVSPDQVICIMTQCDITYESFFPSGLPRSVEVSLAFSQVAQTGGSIYFPRGSDELDDVVKTGTSKVFPYPLKVKIT